MEILVRPEIYNDIEAITALNTLAFGQPAEAKLVNLLRENCAFIPELSLVAMDGDKVVGHILFTIATIKRDEGGEVKVLALAPMAVLPTMQQQGVGSLLVKEGLKRAQQLPYPGVIVLGHEHYYPKFGFKPASTWGIRCPYPGVGDAHWMALELQPNGLANTLGKVEYPKEFDAVG